MEAALISSPRISWPGDAWTVVPRPNPHARLGLLCFPYAGAGTAAYQGWAEDLPPEIEVCLVRLPGRESRLSEEPYRRLSALVPVLATALQPYIDASAGRPFALFGHSMGALIVFELARFLRRARCCEPIHLVVSGRPAPQLPVAPDHVMLQEMTEDQLIERLRTLNGTPKLLLDNPELLRTFLPTLRADFSIVETYTYEVGEPLECGISACGGVLDSDVPMEAVEAWRGQTRGRFSSRLSPGDHFFLLQRDGRQDLLDHIVKDLHPFLAGEQ